MKLAVIIDGESLARFQLDALDAVEGCDEITILSCTNSHNAKQLGKHALYYALNLLSIRNRMTRQVPIASGTKRIARTLHFQSRYEGIWQHLPDDVLDWARAARPDLILKFGMNLLRIPPDLTPPILSYHHGDPDEFRGRPAGFYELLQGRGAMGQIVQLLSNRLDAGAVVAFAETKVRPYSYRATLIEAFRHSPLLINPAIRNALAGRTIAKPCKGKNYRLPTNGTVLRFALRLGAEKIRRVLYGAFREKAWQVSTAPVARVRELIEAFPGRSTWRTWPVAPRYRFAADPFFLPGRDAIIAEALDRRTGLGEIVLLDGTDSHPLLAPPGGHVSYPAPIRLANTTYILPEIAGWSVPQLYRLGEDRLEDDRRLSIQGNPKLLDPTLFPWRGRLYLFGNVSDEGSNVLHLWSADTIADTFVRHPASPIRISPSGSRMGGLPFLDGTDLVRPGQSFLSGYGDGLFLFRIDRLSADEYEETMIGEVRFEHVSGPHTLNVSGGTMVFDWYQDRFAPLAGWRRLRSRLRKVRRKGETA